MEKELLEIICCPDDKEDLKLKKDKLECKKCKRIFYIRNGVPVLLPKYLD